MIEIFPKIDHKFYFNFTTYVARVRFGIRVRVRRDLAIKKLLKIFLFIFYIYFYY